MIRHNWRSTLETICIPLAALLVSLLLFGIFCAVAGANPVGVYASISKAAFGSWRAFQNTLLRAAPLMLSSLALPCTAATSTMPANPAQEPAKKQ